MPIQTDSAIQIRLRINDKPRRTTQGFVGDGLSSAFDLGALPGGLVSAQGAGGGPTAFIPVGAGGGTAWSATGCTFTYYPPLVTFSGVISAGSAFQCVYNHAVFSEAEVDYVTGNYGDLNGMTLEFINALMADYSKRVSWAGGGVNYSDSDAFRNLKDWRDSIYASMTVESGPQGGFESFAEQQQYDMPGWG